MGDVLDLVEYILAADPRTGSPTCRSLSTADESSSKSSGISCARASSDHRMVSIKVPIHTIQGVLATIGIAYILGS